MVPFQQDPDFVARPVIQSWIDEHLKGATNRLALIGMGGFGYVVPGSVHVVIIANLGEGNRRLPLKLRMALTAPNLRRVFSGFMAARKRHSKNPIDRLLISWYYLVATILQPTFWPLCGTGCWETM